MQGAMFKQSLRKWNELKAFPSAKLSDYKKLLYVSRTCGKTKDAFCWNFGNELTLVPGTSRER